MKIGFIDRSDASWSAGASYTRSVVNALAAGLPGGDELLVLSGQAGVTDLPSKVRAMRVEGARPTSLDLQKLVESNRIDVVLPVTEILTTQTACARVGWIPDFQHRRLPQYYTQDQCRLRDSHFARLLKTCEAMMFSSHAVLADFQEFYPDYSGTSGVVPFSSSLAWNPVAMQGDPLPVLGKYALPKAFALVINQFWRHKNHRLVVEAVAQARAINPNVHVVMAGMLSDSRDVTNAHISAIVQRLSTERLFENISVLGEVPGEDLHRLLRCAAVVIQPSEFEGWSTTVQDAVALGKPLCCSDIPTHREQVPQAFFFGLDDAAGLARHLAGFDWSIPGWTGAEMEQRNLEAERLRGEEWGRDLVEICRRAVQRYRQDPEAHSRDGSALDDLKQQPATYIEYLESQLQRLENVEKNLRTQISELRETNQKAWTTAEDLRLRLVAALEESTTLRDQYWREREKTLRECVRDRVFGRKEKTTR